jgi:hypothetical protein
MAVLGATNSVYVLTNLAQADNNASFRCILTNAIGLTISSVAVLTVNQDTNPPILLRVQNLGATNVIVTFSEPVEPLSATNRSNYALNNGVTIARATFGSNTRTIALTTSPLQFGTNYVLVVNNVRDRAAAPPNVIAPNSAFSFTATELTPEDIGNVTVPGTITTTTGGFDIASAGTAIGGTSDQFQLSYQLRTGDFDVQARVQTLGLSDPWARAGLMARETLGANSRFAGVFATPSIHGACFQARGAIGGATAISGFFPVNYPNTWLRLRRGGSQFSGYASFDGQLWTQLGATNIAMPATVYFGMAV